ncbi:MAG: YIP1 family protein [Candidatus Parvarchaeota archaeon]|nr:YIP1 family protein [Candidatus Jingweiarchaeum tengchongense]MCW1298163.1 YIP1 family protein [Candidatus Jingweiarchaeum tengchongense]MCW1299961.1 YIP1 family protein [Candidatus Jingweiarchaeum tengchongense]MCW1305054.1 YIP1 family protein [Candidatus Jingweiarchaeum tengchongense]MCW1305583.1 YIP1 family protein [Candidatus Jingweiarchaeum tengchongense]
MIKKFFEILEEPRTFFEKTEKEGWKEPFIFFLKITIMIAILTSIINYLGIESTDFSSAYQAQIMGYRAIRNYFVPRYGPIAYFIEPFLITIFAILILICTTLFLHAIIKLAGGQGSFLNAWKSVCYGVAPCLLGGFIPYFSLFVGFWSLVIQLYIAPIVLYKLKEWKAIILVSAMITLTFIELFLRGTTVNFY